MNFSELVALTSNLPCFKTSFLSAGRSLPQLRLQLDRWEKAGKVVKVTKSVYALAPPYIKIRPNPFAISSILRPASYISLQSALGFYGMIPEYVPCTVSLTTGRPWQIQSPFGRFLFRHIKAPLFWGYTQQVIDDQSCFIATPEKALLDLLYITPNSAAPSFISSLRLQNYEQLNRVVLTDYAQKMGSKKVARAITFLLAELRSDDEGYEL